MKKNIRGNDVYYQIAWSPVQLYDKYRALGIPELPGILCFLSQAAIGVYEYLLFYSCWRNGLRKGIKDVMDTELRRFPEIMSRTEEKNLYFKYTTIDTSIKDQKDIMYWLIKEYRPLYNSDDFEDSKRYKDIYMKELTMDSDAVIERLRKTHS